ncbi:DAK2 domain-containing protein [Verrucomicrobiaceae bacterium N1E253]|uniref:DAK2 domain-containing protein n=1 Tax=Oceaniferula marina TaxID=2748318 RepID=A0A851GFY1_9BACT|nr:DAK2 domain-containing protein [Oceaniferula marina]NWK54701.1 DAK2 domain-containing protein [Oceaniferula marina]
MTTSLTLDHLKAMFAAGLTAVTEAKEELSSLDAATGDGDHGTAICQAMTAICNTADKGTDLKQSLNDMGFAAMMESCGSTSTLIGALLLGMSDGVDGNELSPAAVATMFNSGLANLRQQTKADIGDKTMMDALIPAITAIDTHQGSDLSTMFNTAAKAAADGRDATKDMVAKFGRARNLGDRVIGHTDAGATSIALIFQAFANSLD